jgi:hypothetical protein
MGPQLRHRQTKGAETVARSPTVTAPHLDSTPWPPRWKGGAPYNQLVAIRCWAVGTAKSNRDRVWDSNWRTTLKSLLDVIQK